MKLGVCYYPEHWREMRWAQDALRLKAVGVSVVRMAEFAWALLEPRPGQFEFDWLDRAVEVFAKQDFQIVLGTPTAAPPAWLSQAHPDILHVDIQRVRRAHGARRHYCPNSPTFHEFTRAIVSAMASRYGKHAAVSGWQIDNEFGEADTGRCYCDNCAAAFRTWLESRYGTLAALNDAWGSAFWSETYDDWSQIEPPRATLGNPPNPSHALDYARFSSDSYARYMRLQTETLRAHINANQFITHNFMGVYPDLDQFALAELLTFAAWDSYPTGIAERWQDSSTAEKELYAYDVGNPMLTGMEHALTRGVKGGKPYWVMEQQAGHVNWGEYNPSPRPGTIPLWLWHNFASGAETTVIFRERATLLAQEQYHSGLFEHDGSEALGYRELRDFAPALAVMRELQNTRVQNQVALLVSYDDLWAIQAQPHRRSFSYWELIYTWYAALQRAGVPCDVISADAPLDSYKLVIAATLHLGEPARVPALEEYVSKGGHLVMGIRSGFKTPTNLVTEEPLPGVWRALVGARVTSWQSLPPGVIKPVALRWRGWQRVEAGMWVETLETEQAGTLASYAGQELDGLTAMTVNQLGAGRVMYVGWQPDAAQADTLIGSLLPEAGVEPIGILTPGVIAGRRIDGERNFVLLLNFTDEPKRVWLNQSPVRDLLGTDAPSKEITVPPRGVRALETSSDSSGG